MKIRLTREFAFEAAHALEMYDGECRQIHGHSYKLFVTVRGEINEQENNPKDGMVIDFKDFKNAVEKVIVKPFDHAFIIKNTPQNEKISKEMSRKWTKIVMTNYQPTCENMLADFVDKLSAELPRNVCLVEIKLYETANSAATWRMEDNI